MPELQKLGTLGAGKRADGAIEVRQIVRALNKSYEESITSGVKIHSINADFGYNAIKGWIINDGAGAFLIDFTRDGITYGEKWTMRPGERTDFDGLDIHSVRLTFITLAASYRIWQA